ncbi:flagellar hook-length control protein FliK [Bacillus massilinigeriensis]|uniref:flagellar hook-length control protein FliK n=1 Tax=Bacillus massilionigeriensis TaxID=1805475 RepID=UPI00096B2CCE|nr:flagellar hook-length control protein FliK [Bacillus massilionigeriensis]
MEIGALGFINSMSPITSKENSSGQASGGFVGLLNAQIQGKTGEQSQSNDSLQDMLTESDLQSLVDFINTGDILDLDNGFALLDKILSSGDKDLMEMIKDFLEISEASIQEAIQSLKNLISQISIPSNQPDVILPVSELENDEKEENGIENVLNSLIAILQTISSLPAEDLKKVTSNDFSVVVKMTKLLELVSNHQDGFGNNQQMKEMLKKISEKIEIFLESQKHPSRTEFLRKTFAPIVTEMNQRDEAKKLVSMEDNLKSEISKLLKQTDIRSKGTSSGNGESGMQNKSELLNGPAFQFQQMSKVEQMTLTLEKNGKPVTTEQLIQQFESILSKSSLLKSGDTQRLLLKLNPEHLGSLRIELIQKESTLVAKIMASTGAAKEALESQINHLKQAFSSQNIQFERIEVSQSWNQNENNLNQEHQGREQQRQEQRKQESEKNQEDGFYQSFEDALLHAEV